MTRRAVDDTALDNIAPGNTALTRALRALAEDEARVETPSRVEAALMANWDKHCEERRHPKRAARNRTRTFVRGAATMAAGVVLFGAVMFERELMPIRVDLPRVDLPPRPAMPSDEADLTLPSNASGNAATVQGSIDSRPREPRSTVVLVGGPMASGELVQVVRMRVDRSALNALGITQNGYGETVEVDVLVGEDGVARGLRLPL